ncbi:MAG: gamma carbonic anhydrase family protein [Planctomycetes bacterium]|nr:gamma carbonic anhydrase family protein [Planctomycetota bacterium]
MSASPLMTPFGEGAVAQGATVIGDVSLGRWSSIWFGCVVRADVAAIRIGRGTNIQDLSMIHPEHDQDVEIGAEVTIGHNAVIHCRRVGSLSLIGIGAVLLPGVVVGEKCIIGAGSLLTIGMQVPDRSLVLGTPAKVIRTLKPHEIEGLYESAERYIHLARHHGATF